MTRFTTTLSIGLTLAIALAAGMVGWRVFSFSPPVSDSSYADPAVGTAFYAAVNDVLSGTNSSALAAIVTSDFVNHSDGATSGELSEQLAAFGTSFPGTQLQVMGMEPTANNLVVSLAQITLPSVKVADLTLSAQPFDGGYEMLRLRNGKVAERWSGTLPALAVTTFPEASLETHDSANMTVQLIRTELPDGAELSWKPGRSNVLLVETGAITVRLDWNRQGAPENQVVTVSAGEVLPISSNTKVRIEPALSEPATVLIYSTWKVQPTDLPTSSHSIGATSRLLWTSNLPVSLNGGWTVSFATMQLPRRVDVTLNGGSAMEVLLCAESAAVQVVTGNGLVESLSADLTSIDQSNVVVLEAGSAAHVTGADSIELQSGADAGETVWLITIAPIGSQTPTA